MPVVDGVDECCARFFSGAGVALGLERFVIERERSGAIRRPLGLAYPTGSYWLVYPEGQRRNRALEAFRRWLLVSSESRE